MPSRNLLNIQLSVIEKYLHRTPSQGRPTLRLGGTCGTRHVGQAICGTVGPLPLEIEYLL